jgi:virulence factor Mce-like protein
VRRIALTTALVVGVVVALAVGLGASGDSSGYRVRAIFDNASNVVLGEDVKTAGATIGSVDSLDVTKDKKAAVVLRIESEGFAPFRANARCTIRPQSLIGEKYVECTPGSAPSPELREIGDGQTGEGQHLLPVEQTSSPVDLDLINNTLRRPFRERFAIILREFGTALSGNGPALKEAIHRANPALRDTDRVLGMLADQNRTLAQLAVDSDRVLAPLAARRERVADFIVQANTTAQATAERGAALERTFERFPTFLRELEPTLRELGALSDEMTPVLVDLDRAAPSLNRFILELGPFSRAATPAIESLGDAADIGGPALRRSRPLIRQLIKFGRNARPVSKQLDLITRSLDKSGAIERIMDYLFFQTTAVNGFDSLGHYLRAELLTNLCSLYSTTPGLGCNSNFTVTESRPGGGSAKKASLDGARKKLEDLQAQQAEPHLAPAPEGIPGKRPVNPFDALNELVNPRFQRERERARERLRGAAAEGRSPLLRDRDATEAAIEWLLGND